MGHLTGDYEQDGVIRLPFDAGTAAWAQAARQVALDVVKTPGDLRHGKTWRVGVDDLPNTPDGSIGDVPLRGLWGAYVTAPTTWHPAQLSVVYPGYPRQDPNETDANHRFRLNRDAAHVDGLLPRGPDKRRHLREPHAFVLGLPLNDATGSPLVVWPGSHVMMQAAFARCFAGVDTAGWGDVDVTDAYQAARQEVFARCPRVEVPASPGEATLVHRHLLHGVAPWGQGHAPAEGRMIAYFRPQVADLRDWL